MSAATDPIRQGFVTSLGHPGGNITGLTLLAENLYGKQLELLKEAVPKLSQVAFLRIESYPSRSPEVDRAARALRLEVKDFPVTAAQDIKPAFAAMNSARMGAVLVPADPLILDAHRDEIVALAASHALPAIYSFREFSQSGGPHVVRC